MTSAMTNAAAIVRMVSANPPFRRFSSLDTVIGREGSGGATRQPLSRMSRYHILLPRRAETSRGEADAGDRRVRFDERGWEATIAAYRAAEQRGPSSKTKFTCSSCGSNVWGKPDTETICTPCAIQAAQNDPAVVGLLKHYQMRAADAAPLSEAARSYDTKAARCLSPAAASARRGQHPLPDKAARRAGRVRRLLRPRSIQNVSGLSQGLAGRAAAGWRAPG